MRISSFLPLLLLSVVAAAPSTYTSYRHGGVASEVEVCSAIGASTIRNGGNAVDAMISTVLCVGTIGMYHSGIGGGGFALIRTPRGEYDFIDFRETAPAAATETMFVNRTGSPSLYSGEAAAVPGELRGLERMHRKYGTVSWSKLVRPSVRLARDGFKVNGDLALATNGLDFLVKDPAWAVDFAPNGEVLQEGETMYRRRYADTLEIIAKKGVRAFYEGPMAADTVATLKAKGGIMTEQDLASYKVVHREPIEVDYRGYKLTSGSAPCSGGVMLSALKIFEGFDTGEEDMGLTTHWLIESTKFAYGQRSEFGDPSFLVNISSYQKHILTPAVTTQIRNVIKDASILPNISFYSPRGYESLETPGTSHIATLDTSGFAVSLTTTINTFFGSRVISPRTGIIMNNEMDDFSVPGSSNFFGFLPSPANYIRPGKRPLSSISPTIVETSDGEPYFVIGAAGGSRIITATLQNIRNVLDKGMSAREALKSPRWHDQLSPTVTRIEYTYDNSTVAELVKRGHNVTRIDGRGQSSAQGVLWSKKGLEAVGEPRQVGSGGVVV